MSDLLTDGDLTELERLDREATPGEWIPGETKRSGHWIVEKPNGGTIAWTSISEDHSEIILANAALIAAARNALPRLLAEVRRSRSSAPPDLAGIEAMLAIHAEHYASGRQADGEDQGTEILSAIRALAGERDAARAETQRTIGACDEKLRQMNKRMSKMANRREQWRARAESALASGASAPPPEGVLEDTLETEALRGERDNAVARAAESDGWRHVAAYFLGDYVDTHSPSESRAEAIRRALASTESPRATDADRPAEDFLDPQKTSIEEVDAAIRAEGGDPDEIGRHGAQLVAKLLAERERAIGNVAYGPCTCGVIGIGAQHASTCQRFGQNGNEYARAAPPSQGEPGDEMRGAGRQVRCLACKHVYLNDVDGCPKCGDTLRTSVAPGVSAGSSGTPATKKGDDHG